MPPIVDSLLAITAAGRSMEPRFIEDARRSYFAGLPSLGDAQVFTDKQPFNFEAIGLIVALFPDARIVHVRREPLATGISIYRQEFHPAWSFAHEFADIAAVQAHEAHLMQAWKARFADNIFTLDLAALVGDSASVSRQLLTACGLEWHERCASYRQIERPILSRAAVEVRDELRAGDARARRYDTYLEPLATELRKQGLDPHTGELVSR
jgi:hypothetical protein